MVDGINSNSSSEIYKKQNTSATSSTSDVDSSTSASDAAFEAWLAGKIAEQQDEENLSYDSTVDDLQKQIDELQKLQNDAEPSGFEKAVTITSTIAAGAAQILSALNTGASGSDGSGTSKPSDLDSAMKACQGENPSQVDVTALNKYIDKAEKKLNKKMSDLTKGNDQLGNLEQSLAANVAQQDENISNINTALAGLEGAADATKAKIDGVEVQIKANDQAVQQNQDTIAKYASEEAEGKSNLQILNDALNGPKGANKAKTDKEAEINALSEPKAGDYKKTIENSDGTKSQVNDTDAYNKAKQEYEAKKAKLERELKNIKNEIANLESCIQVGEQTLAQITASKEQSEGELEMLLGTHEDLKGKETELAAAKSSLIDNAKDAQSKKTDAEKQKALSETNKTKAQKELDNYKKKLDDLYKEKQHIDEAKLVYAEANVKLNGAKPDSKPRQ